MTTGAASSPTPEAASLDEGPGLSLGSPATSFALPGLHGETWTLDALCAMGKPVLLIFSDPHCVPCNALLPELGRWQREHASTLTIALVSRGGAEANRAKAAEHGLIHVLLQRDREVAAAYGANGTPSAVLVRSDGAIGSHVAAGVQAIRELVTATIGGTAPSSKRTHPGGRAPAPSPLIAAPDSSGNGTAEGRGWEASPQVGDPAPALALPDAAGHLISLAAFRPSPTVVVFWHPNCRACAQLLDCLKVWEANLPPDAPTLLVVVEGKAQANGATELRSTVVLEPTLEAGRAFGAQSVPSAILIDSDGRVASPLVKCPQPWWHF